MAAQKKIFGRVPTYHGAYSPGKSYDRLNRVTLYGSEFQSKSDGNNTAPAVLSEDGKSVVFNTSNWDIISNGTDAFLADKKISDIYTNTSVYRVSQFHSHTGFWEVVPYDAEAQTFLTASTYNKNDKVNVPNVPNKTFRATKTLQGITPDINTISNKFTLEEAIYFVPEEFHSDGMEIAFISSENSQPVIYRFAGGIFTEKKNWKDDVYDKLSELEEYANMYLYERGSINTINGENYDNECLTNRLRLTSIASGIKNIKANGGVSFTVFYYSQIGEFQNMLPSYTKNIHIGLSENIRLVIKKDDDSDIENIDEILKQIEIRTQDVVINLVGSGVDGTTAGAINVGDVYLNTNTNLLRQCIVEPPSIEFKTLDYDKDNIYILNGSEYIYRNGKLRPKYIFNYKPIVGIEQNNLISYELGSIDTNNGLNYYLNNRIRSIGKLKNVQRVYTTNTDLLVKCAKYDEEGNFLGLTNGYANESFPNCYETRILIKRSNDEPFESIEDYINYVHIDFYSSTLYLTGEGEKGGIGGVTKVGDVYYNTLTKKLRLCISFISEEDSYYEDLFNTKLIYILNGKTYIYRNDVLSPTFDTTSSSDKKFIIGSPSVYISETYPHTDMSNYKSPQLYEIYDELVKKYPNIIKREENIGNGSDGADLRQYSIRFQNPVFTRTEGSISPNLWNEEFEYTTALIISGVHGDEKTASYGLALAVKELVESNEPWAKFIKSNCILKIVPLVNVWGYDNNSRNNYNGVNINRDAKEFIQPETRAIRNWLIKNNRAKVFMDLHNTCGYYTYFEINPLDKYAKQYVQASAKLASTLYENWKTNVYKDNGKNYPYLYGMHSQFDGLIISYANDMGMIGHITETPRDVQTGACRPTNYLDCCKITKDMFINIIQTYIIL